MEIKMSCQDHSSPPWYPNSSEDREVAIVGDRNDEGFFEMFGDRPSTGDLFELAWQGRGGGNSMDQVHHCLPLPPEPPSEEEMATWLYPIVRGEVEPVTTSMDQPACGDIVDGRNAALKTEVKYIENKGSDSIMSRKPAAGGRRSHHSETHNLTEKRRRWKINEKFKTLQQLVPGCHKGNQASILDQTIQYMKSLQQQTEAMAIGCSMRPAPAAVNPIVQTPAAATVGLPPQATFAPGMLVRGLVRVGGVLAPATAPMASFVPMLPLFRHPADAVMVHAAPMLQYPENVVLPNVASPPARNQG